MVLPYYYYLLLSLKSNFSEPQTDPNPLPTLAPPIFFSKDFSRAAPTDLENRCGTDVCGCTNRIEGANGMLLIEYPWMASLLYETSDPNDFGCAGTLINERYVLTSAQCATKRNLTKVLLGQPRRYRSWYKKTQIYYPPPEEEYTIETISIHIKYNPRTLANDIALIRLSSIVHDHGFRTPVCLPVGKHVRAGFGAKYGLDTGSTNLGRDSYLTFLLMEDRVSIKKLEYCRGFKNNTLLPKKQICTGGEGDGDFDKFVIGGPLVVTMPGETNDGAPQYVQYGILSYEQIMDSGKVHSRVYTKVRSYRQWIANNIIPWDI